MSESNTEPRLVSCIIPVFNRAEMVCEAIASVLEQDYRPIQILVIDDGSTDNTAKVLDELATVHPEISVLRQPNAGPGVAREHGRKHARGEYIQYLDSDDLLLAGKFSQQVKALIDNPDCDVAYGKTEEVVYGEPRKGVAARETGQRHAAIFPRMLTHRWWSTTTPLYRRSVTDRAGAWLPTCAEEDWEYDCKIAALGGKLAYVDAFVSLKREHGSHLATGGTVDPGKLTDRCLARSQMFKHASQYVSLAQKPAEFTDQDWDHFSRSVFQLARDCALQGMKQPAGNMYRLSLEARGKPSVQHRLFKLLYKLLGWRNAARLLHLVGR